MTIITATWEDFARRWAASGITVQESGVCATASGPIIVDSRMLLLGFLHLREENERLRKAAKDASS
jgi:hypothetical protein